MCLCNVIIAMAECPGGRVVSDPGGAKVYYRFRRACMKGRHVVLERLVKEYPGTVVQFVTWTDGGRTHSGTGLHLTVRYDHPLCCQVLLDAGASINARDEEGRTPLMFARSEAVAARLLRRGANAHLRDKNNSTVLHFCAYHCRHEMVGTLLSERREAIVNYEDGAGQTPLMLAVAADVGNDDDHVAMVTQLVKHGANINLTDASGMSALHILSWHCFRNKLGSLIDELVAVGASLKAVDKNGRTPLFLAVAHNNKLACTELIRRGASVHARDSRGNTPLMLASKKNFTEVCWTLVEAGSRLTGCDVDMNSFLIRAIKDGNATVFDICLRHAVDVHSSDENGDQALVLAAKHRQRHMTRRLLCAGADVNITDHSGRSLLSIAVTLGDASLVCELLKRGATADGSLNFTQLFCDAARKGLVKDMGLYTEAGASLEQRDANGLTALHNAVRCQQPDAVNWLIEQGAEISAFSGKGWTPLHYACAAQPYSSEAPRQLFIVKLLLLKGADPTSCTRAHFPRAQLPIDIARESGNHAVVSALEGSLLAHHLIKAEGAGVKPDAVTVRLAGPPGTGKTTLVKSLRVKHRNRHFRNETQSDEGAMVMHKRTKGIRRKVYTDQTSAQFVLLDLGGHSEFLTTHQVFIGDGTVPVIDCVVVSALDNDLETAAMKWCSLFASRNQPTPLPWPLLMIATRADLASNSQREAVQVVYDRIRKSPNFAQRFRFPYRTPFFLDARKSWKEPMVKLREALTELHQQLGQEAARQPAICQRIVHHLPRMRKQLASPVVHRDRFDECLQQHLGFDELHKSGEAYLSDLLDKALKYLSGFATVLSFSGTLSKNYVVIDPPWLLSDIVGRLMSEPPLPEPHVYYDENGYADKEDVLRVLETPHAPGQVAFSMTVDLGLCLEHQHKVLNPSKLRGKQALKHWRADPSMVVNGGRRLTCKGRIDTTIALFPHLQARFYHRYLSEYEEKLPMWSGGIRVVSGRRSRAEAKVESDVSQSAIDIIVRGPEGSNEECATLLSELADETLLVASEVSAGSGLSMTYYLSARQLLEFSQSGESRDRRIAYSQEAVFDAIRSDHFLSDGNASTPEDPLDLLLSQVDLNQAKRDPLPFVPPPPLQSYISELQWAVALRRLAKEINSFHQCNTLAVGLDLNDRGQDLVMQLREVNELCLPWEIAAKVLTIWISQRDGFCQSTEQRRAMLHHIFERKLYRPSLSEHLDEELLNTEGSLDEPLDELSVETGV